MAATSSGAGRRLVLILAWLGVLALVALVAITVTDVVGRSLFRHSLPGSAEAIAMLMGVAVFCGLGWSQLRHRHVVVDIVLHNLPRAARRVLEMVSQAIAVAITGVLAWQMAVTVAEIWAKGETTMIWRLPFAPPAVLMLVGLVVFLMVLGVQLVGLLLGRRPVDEEDAHER
jgi:TRAP-type C4-dicarboxylate transport system permease small subunit